MLRFNMMMLTPYTEYEQYFQLPNRRCSKYARRRSVSGTACLKSHKLLNINTLTDAIGSNTTSIQQMQTANACIMLHIGAATKRHSANAFELEEN